MKKIINFTAIIVLLSFGVNAQPLYTYSPLEFPKYFGAQYGATIRNIYLGYMETDSTPRFMPLLTHEQCKKIKCIEKYQLEEEIPARRLIDSKTEGTYMLLCPEYDHPKKLFIGIFDEGFELAYQEATGKNIYLMQRISKFNLQKTGFIALVYTKDQKNNYNVRTATKDEIRELYEWIDAEIKNYVSLAGK